MVDKIDWELDTTALAFSSVKDYWRSKRWADIFRAPLRVTEDALTSYAKITNLKDFADTANANLAGAQTVADVLTTWLAYQDLQEIGERLQLAIDGPAYSASIQSMLDEADDVIAPFDNAWQQNYQKVIKNHLYGPQDSPIIVRRVGATSDRKAVDFASGALAVSTGISRTLNGLVSDIESNALPAGFPLDSLVAQVNSLKTDVLQSRLKGTEARYRNYDGKPDVAVLGAISDWNSAMVEIARALDRQLQMEMTAEVFKAGSAIASSITLAIPGAKDVKIAAQAFTLAGIIIEPYKKTFRTDPEEAFYMVPQLMVLSLPAELSNLWRLADDTDQYVRQLLGSRTETSTGEDLTWLARVIASEAGSVWDVDRWVRCTDEERAAVGWTVLNRVRDGSYGKTIKDVVTAKGQYALWPYVRDDKPIPEPTSEVVGLAQKLLNGQISDLTAGATHFFSPIAMPWEGDEGGYISRLKADFANFDTGGGLHQVPGIAKKVYFPSFAVQMRLVSDMKNVRSAYFMFYRSSASSPNPLVKWKSKLGGEANRRLLVAGGTVYVPSGDQHLYALDAATGNLKWKFETGADPLTPVVTRGMVLLGGWIDDYIYALDTATGGLVWKFETDAGQSPRVVNDVVYTRSSKGVHALDILTGSEKWRFETGYKGLRSYPMLLEVSNDSVFMENNNILFALDAATGKLRWKAGAVEDVGLSITTGKNAVVYGGFNSPNLYALDIATGDLLWKFEAEGNVYHIVAGQDAFYTFAGDAGLIYALSTTTGKPKWQYSVPKQTISSLLLQGATLYISLTFGVYAVDATDGHLKWKIERVVPYADLELVAGTMLYFTTTWEQDIYAVQATTGKVKWAFDRPNLPSMTGAEDGIVVADGIAYFGSRDGWVYAVVAP